MRSAQHYPSSHIDAATAPHDTETLELSRTVRFCIPFGTGGLTKQATPRFNTWAAWPSLTGLGAYYELDVRCRGRSDPVTGYLMNIARIDEVVRARAIGAIAEAVRAAQPPDPARLLRDLVEPLQADLDGAVSALRWRLTPFFSLTVEVESMDRVLFRQQFCFSAAHRLHCPELSDEENVAVFGKCNNPNGHGHNYRLEVAVSAPVPGADSAAGLELPKLEQVVDTAVVQRFDHTHLNLDTEAFAKINPSVEHIARVCHDLLREPVADLGACLEHVTVWETDKTSCTYPG